MVVQFLEDESTYAYGSRVQQAACKKLGILPSWQEEFWISNMRVVEKQIKQKRQGITNAMKAIFRGEHTL